MTAVLARARGAPLLLPGVAVVYLSFNAGGFFPGATGFAAVVLAVALAVRVAAAEDPVAGIGRAAAVVLGLLVLYTGLVLASSAWSGSESRALIEFDRALLYTLTFAFFASLGRDPRDLRVVVAGVLGGMAVVCIAAFASRTLPDLVSVSANRDNQRLSFPLTYSNALGLMAALATTFAVHFASDESGSRWARLAGAAAVPVLVGTLFLTFSRAGLVAAVVALGLYLLLGRPRGLPGALLAIVPASVLATAAVYAARALAEPDPTGPTAVAQGRNAFLVVALACLLAVVVRAVTLRLDTRLARSPGVLVQTRWIGASLIVVLCALVVLGVPGRALDQVRAFTEQEDVVTGDQRERFIEVGNNGRIENWRVALDAFRDRPALGEGAGTYQTLWAQMRRVPSTVNDGHSLYLESLAELGLVGALLITAALLAMLGGAVVRLREGPRALYAVVAASSAAWILHAGVDWDWEMPAGALWLFACGGMVLGAPAAQRGGAPVPGRVMRLAVAIGLLAVAVTPAAVSISQVRLNESVQAFLDGDCRRAVDRGLASAGASGVRPEPFQIMAFCDARVTGLGGLAIEQAEAARRRDPDNWEFAYTVALTRGAAGRDPRLAAREALRLNPREPLARGAARAFDTDSRSAWVRRARAAPLPFQGR